MFGFMKSPKQPVRDLNYERNKDEYVRKNFKPMIEQTYPGSEYSRDLGMPREVYESMGYPNNHTEYKATNNIEFADKNPVLSKVWTRSKEDKGKKGVFYSTVFFGIACSYTMPFEAPLYFRVKHRDIHSIKANKQMTVLLGNNDFDEYYEVETNNAELLKSLFPNKIIPYFLDIADKKEKMIEVCLTGNHIHSRLHDKDYLEFSNVEDDSIKSDELKASFNSVLAVVGLKKLITDELNNKLNQ
ncbi:MAG: DUF3137 domain-containing protein [Oscillospiraceae bacterium]|nr:DUF3137 domain-containing protein [Oscillospiraceae bacterium]